MTIFDKSVGNCRFFYFPSRFSFFRHSLCDIIPLAAAKAAINITKELFTMSNTIKKVAKQHGVSVKEVRRDFKEIIPDILFIIFNYVRI